MKKKVAKILKKYGEDKLEVIKNYSPVSKKEKTTAIKTSRKDLNCAIGNVLSKAKKEERNLLAQTLKGDFFEDWDSEESKIIKY